LELNVAYAAGLVGAAGLSMMNSILSYSSVSLVYS
jgi:hypothetical protein